MKFRLQCRRLTTIMIAVLTVVLAFFFVSPASADQVATPVTVMQSTNQPNAPNASEQQSAQPAKQTSLGNTNSQETNQSTSTSDAANANKSATTAAQSTENSTVTNDSSKAQAGQTSRSAVAPTKQVTPNSVQVTIKNGNNDHLINNGDTIDQFTPIRVEVSYDFTGGNIHPGDYFTFSVPDKLSVTSGSTIETNLGTVSIVGNTGRFIFNTEGSDAHGEFFFTVQINPQHTSNGEDVPINITINNVTHPTIKIHYAPGTVNPDERFSKYTMNNDLSKGNLKYAIRVNPTGDVTYTDAVIADQLHTPGFTYKRDSFQVYKVKWSWNGTDWNNQMIGQLDISPVISADGASFTIDLGNQIVKNENHEGFLILYELLYNGKSVSEMTTDERPSDGTVVSNSASLNSSNHSTINYPQTLTVINSGGHGNVQTFDLVVTKVDDFDHPLSGATFQLFRGNDVVGEATTDANGIVRFHGLLRGTYR
ncbi:MAG: SpaA isopeptide-forming pilin-related protein, partial [Limosilactobacillus sp.]